MEQYFVNKKAMYEFILINCDRKTQTSLLDASYKCYSNKDAAKKWFDNIRQHIDDDKAIRQLERLYDDMVY